MDKYLKHYCEINNFTTEEMENDELLKAIESTAEFNCFKLNIITRELFAQVTEKLNLINKEL